MWDSSLAAKLILIIKETNGSSTNTLLSLSQWPSTSISQLTTTPTHCNSQSPLSTQTIRTLGKVKATRSMILAATSRQTSILSRIASTHAQTHGKSQTRLKTEWHTGTRRHLNRKYSTFTKPIMSAIDYHLIARIILSTRRMVERMEALVELRLSHRQPLTRLIWVLSRSDQTASLCTIAVSNFGLLLSKENTSTLTLRSF